MHPGGNVLNDAVELTEHFLVVGGQIIQEVSRRVIVGSQGRGHVPVVARRLPVQHGDLV